jgi:hypothetical protein
VLCGVHFSKCPVLSFSLHMAGAATEQGEPQSESDFLQVQMDEIGDDDVRAQSIVFQESVMFIKVRG